MDILLFFIVCFIIGFFIGRLTFRPNDVPPPELLEDLSEYERDAIIRKCKGRLM